MAKARRVKGIDCRGTVEDNARRIIDVRLSELFAFAKYVDDPANVTELHDLRIAAKRLRYSLELFRFAFPKQLEALIDEVKTVQEHIGDMHDADVMIERVREVLLEDAAGRAARLMEIAGAVERGTIAQRHQRIRSAMTNRTTPRDEIAFYTLIAHRAEDRDRAYRQFVAHWRALEGSDFPGRLRRLVGLERQVVEVPTPVAELEQIAVA
jgi:CHAD domain-containing protein